MFPDLSSDSKILAVTASNGQESSWGTYCGDEATGKLEISGSCVSGALLKGKAQRNARAIGWWPNFCDTPKWSYPATTGGAVELL